MEINLSTWVPIAQGIVTIFALLVGAYVALAWRDKELATAERDLARRVLIGLYKVRDAIQNSRLPYSFSEEADTPAEKEEARQRHGRLLAEVQARLDALDVELLEAEAVWGDELKRLCRPFKITGIQLQATSYLFYTMEGNDPDERAEYVAKLFRPADPRSEDEFSNKLKKHVAEIEDMLRPKLRLRGRGALLRTVKSLFRRGNLRGLGHR